MSAALSMAVSSPRRPPAGLGGLVGSVLINLVAPAMLFRVVAGWFAAGSPWPLLVCALIPVLDLAAVFALKRATDVMAVISLVQLAVGIAITLATHSIRLALELHALQAGALGLVFAGSLAIRRPLIRSLARQAMAGDDPERQASFDARALRPATRRVFDVMTLIWAASLIGQSVLLFIACRALSADDYVTLHNIVSYGANAALAWGCIRYGRRRSARQDGAGAEPGSPR